MDETTSFGGSCSRDFPVVWWSRVLLRDISARVMMVTHNGVSTRSRESRAITSLLEASSKTPILSFRQTDPRSYLRQYRSYSIGRRRPTQRRKRRISVGTTCSSVMGTTKTIFPPSSRTAGLSRTRSFTQPLNTTAPALCCELVPPTSPTLPTSCTGSICCSSAVCFSMPGLSY